MTGSRCRGLTKATVAKRRLRIAPAHGIDSQSAVTLATRSARHRVNEWLEWAEGHPSLDAFVCVFHTNTNQPQMLARDSMHTVHLHV